MNVYTHRLFDGHWPVGTAAVVVAASIEEAVELLETALAEAGLPQVVVPEHFAPLDTSVPHAVILRDGNY